VFRFKAEKKVATLYDIDIFSASKIEYSIIKPNHSHPCVVIRFMFKPDSSCLLAEAHVSVDITEAIPVPVFGFLFN